MAEMKIVRFRMLILFKTFHCLRYIPLEVLKLQDLNQPVKHRFLL